MRKVLLWPGLLMLSVAVVGCGGNGEEDAQTPEGGAATAAEKEKGAASATADKGSATAEETKAAHGKTAAKATGSLANGQRVGVDTTYVLPEAVMVLVVHPQQLLKSPLLANNPQVKAGMAEITQKLGVSPGDIEQLVISGGPPAGPEGIQKPMSIVAKLSKPHKGKETLMAIAAETPEMGEVEELEYNGAKYFHAKRAEKADDAAEPSPFDGPGFGPQPSGPEEGYALLPDEMTIVAAEDEEVIKKLIDGKGTVKTDLTEAMAKLDASSDVVLLLRLNDQLREMATSAPNPDASDLMQQLTAQTNQAVLRASISPDIQVQLTMSMVDEKAAGDVDQKITGLVQDGLAGLNGQIDQLKAAGPGDPGAAMMMPMLSEFKKILDGISTERSGNDVVVNMGGLNEVEYEVIAQSLMTMFMFANMGGGAPGGDFGPPGGDFDAPSDDFGAPAEEAPAEETPAENDGN